MVSRTKERALDPLLVPALPALACGHAVNICWLRSASASDTLAHSIRAAPRLCQSLRALKSCSILRAACAQPAAQSPGDGRTCVSSYFWGKLGKFVKKKVSGFGDITPLYLGRRNAVAWKRP
jgi:hypothetical protein